MVLFHARCSGNVSSSSMRLAAKNAAAEQRLDESKGQVVWVKKYPRVITSPT